MKVIVNNCIRIPISLFKEKGVFSKPKTSGAIHWGKNSITFEYCNGWLSFYYLANGNPKTANFWIEERPTNLGIGTRFFFLCPKTGKLCTKLLITPDGNMVTRSMLDRIVYTYNNKSQRGRIFDKIARANDVPVRKYGKEYYSGKLTPYGKRLKRWEDVNDLATRVVALFANGFSK